METGKKNVFEIRTDLALEEKERFPGNGGEIPGIELQKWEEKEAGICMTKVFIKDKNGAKVMGKPQGTYLTLESSALAKKDEDFHREVSDKLAECIRILMEEHQIFPDSSSILVVGLGNADATPDSLGPRVLEHLQMTRYLNLEYGKTFCRKNGYPVLSGIVPGVMAQTGMETAEIIKGVIHEINPDAVLVVDALAARSVHRLGVTVQLSDTGIHPGSGVGNHRNALTEEVLGIPVFAIGVPMVVGAAAIVQDTVDVIIEILKKEKGMEAYGAAIEAMDTEEQYKLIREILEPRFGPMYVTPHNIDERVEMLSYTISEAIHGALFQ